MVGKVIPFENNPRFGIYEWTTYKDGDEVVDNVLIAELSDDGEPRHIYATLVIDRKGGIKLHCNIDPPFKTVRNLFELIDAREKEYDRHGQTKI